MNHEEKETFLKALVKKYMTLGIKLDLSCSPELFGKELRIKGLFVWGRVKQPESIQLANIECDIIIYNQTAMDKVHPPMDYHIFQLRDLQEFPYIAAVKVHHDEVK